MPLSPGAKLGPYEVLAPLGAGGMGEVYRARDPRLDRDVAIKVLPAEVGGDAERLARFRREARLLASLNHPNVAHLYGFETATADDGSQVHFIAMELAEGEDLGVRLRRGAIPVEDATAIAKQIAEAVEEAHEHGIVHRDLKPANIKVAADGKVKVLDFGLAKAWTGEAAPGTSSDDLSHSPTLARTGTSAGLILGTAAYMSPEQARGKPVDKRADIWAFGVVLYEMLSGTRLFQGETVSDTLAAVLKTDPDWKLLPAALPPAVARLLHRCLERDPRRRLRDIGEARLALDGTEPAAVATEPHPVVLRPSILSRLGPVVAAVVLTAGAVALLGSRGARVSLDAAHFVPFAVEAGVQSMPAWSPDGHSLAYSGEVAGYYQIFTRQVGQSTPAQLTSFEADCLYPQWDPTGTRVFFQRAPGNQSAKVTQEGEVWVVSAAGGPPERLTESMPAFTVAPAGNAILSLKPTGKPAEGPFELWSHDLESGTARRLRSLSDRWRDPPSSGALRFSPDGARLALLSSVENEILLFPNPLTTPGGEPRRVRLASPEGGTVQLAEFSWLPDNRQLVVALRDQRGGDKSIWLGDLERGTVTRVTASVQWESTPVVAPDGSRLAFSVSPFDWDILEVELPGGQSRPLVASSRYDGWGEWMPDGSGIFYSTLRTGRPEIWAEGFRDHATRAIVTAADAFPGGPSFVLTQSAVSPDARSIAYVRYGVNEQRIYISAIAGSRPVRLTVDAGGEAEDAPVWSPDGRWILFRRGQLLMKALAAGGTPGTVLASDQPAANDGQRAHWLPEGGTVIYRAVDGLKQVSADGGQARLVTREQPALWDLSPDGRLLYAILERERRAIDLSTIDVPTGAVRTLRSLGRRPLTPDYNGYPDTLRALRVSPDGERLMYAYLKPEADIWILEGFAPQSRPWWRPSWR